jgi:hypothetical protein
MQRMLKLLFTAITILIITGCATSNLSYENEKLNLRINDTSLQMHGTRLEKKNENFSTLFLTQNLLRLDDGSLVVYEETVTDMQYRFDPTTPSSIKIIFDAERVIKLHYNTFIYAFQVILKDNRVLNVLVAQGYDQELQMVYGMSTRKLNDMLIKLGQNVQPVYYKNVINLSNEPSPYMSKWSIPKVHLVPLVVPIARIGRF